VGGDNTLARQINNNVGNGKPGLISQENFVCVSLHSKWQCNPFSFVPNKIGELESNSKIKNIRDLWRCISDFKRGYQPRTTVVNSYKIPISVKHNNFII
jgi:hypothetical protein